MATRPLHFIWIADCSGSMNANGKIESLNTAIHESVPHMQNEAKENPNAQVMVRAITFSSGARWHIASPTPVEAFRWEDVRAEGVTDMGRALTMVGEELMKLPERGLPPVLVLISDGQPTDNYSKGLNTIMDHGWGKKAVRMSIAIGEDADLEVLQQFIGHPEFKPLQANNPEALVRHIKWVSTAVLKSASSPASQPAGTSSTPTTNVPIPAAPDTSPTTEDDVWGEVW
jgi:uncharacterized protein YegL